MHYLCFDFDRVYGDLVVFFTDGRGSDDSFVKTDWNCLTSISAFPLLSLIIFPLDLKCAIPKESCFFDLTNQRNKTLSE